MSFLERRRPIISRLRRARHPENLDRFDECYLARCPWFASAQRVRGRDGQPQNSVRHEPAAAPRCRLAFAFQVGAAEQFLSAALTDSGRGHLDYEPAYDIRMIQRELQRRFGPLPTVTTDNPLFSRSPRTVVPIGRTMPHPDVSVVAADFEGVRQPVRQTPESSVGVEPASSHERSAGSSETAAAS